VTITATLIATSVIDNYASAIGEPLDEESASRAHAVLGSSKIVQLSPITRGRLTSSPSAHLKHGIANNAITDIDKAAPDVSDAAQCGVVSAGSFGVYDHAEGRPC